jgi:hypothetical protein
MRQSHLATLAIVLMPAILGGAPGVARAQDEGAGPGAGILTCTSAIEGTVQCMGQKLCVCLFDPGGTMTGRPPRHRWDCGIDRPSCGTVPADIGGGNAAGSMMLSPQVILPFPPGPPLPPYRGR